MSPPRLHVITATGCDKALVLRRGPTGQVASLLWDRGSDSFEMGQWLKGRIYEHRADLSPDARHMVYFAGTGQRWWTAVSRAPWLRALVFLPQGDTWHGGGAFDSDGRLWLNGATAGDTAWPDGLRPAEVTAFPHGTDGFHMGDMYAAMMAKRGWQHVSGSGYDAVLCKPAGKGWSVELRFVLSAPNRSIIANRYALIHPGSGARVEQPDWEWAEPRGAGVQFAQSGALHAAEVTPEGGVTAARVIRDFSEMSFEAIPAPYEGLSSGEAVR